MKDKGFVEYVVGDLFSYLSDVSAKSMFGGYGIYRSGVMFALIADGELYFKVSEESKKEYENLNSRAFTYQKEGKVQEMSYWYINEDVQENTALFRSLAESAFDFALESSIKKNKKKG